MKTGDLVVATRKGDVIFSASSGEDRYFGIFIKEEYGDLYIECIGGEHTGRFGPDLWDVEVINENW